MSLGALLRMNGYAVLVVFVIIGVPMFAFFQIEFCRYEREMKRLGIPPERW